MKLGNKFCLVLPFIFFVNILMAEQKITTSPLINIEKIKPSFEEPNENDNFSKNENLRKKKNIKNLESSHVVLIGLDKITAKSSELVVKLNESKKFDL